MILITLEDGLVQSVKTDRPELLKNEVVVVADRDTDDSSDDESLVDLLRKGDPVHVHTEKLGKLPARQLARIERWRAEE